MASNSPYVDGGTMIVGGQYLATAQTNQSSDGWRNLQVDAAGNLCVNVKVGGGGGGGGGAVTIADPTTSTNQVAVLAPGSSGSFAIAVQGVTGGVPQPVSATSLPLPTGAATSAKQPALGTAGSASTDVLSVQGIASMTPLKVDGSGVTQPVSGTFWQATQPISAASLPLPSGASTSAKQPALGTAGSASTDVITVQGIASMTALLVNGSGVTQPISAASLPLPTGASTAAKQPALGTAGSASSDVITVQGIASMTALKVDPSGVTSPVSLATLPALVASTANIGNVGGKTSLISVTPTLTASSAYASGNEVGGLMTFANAFLTAGSGVLQTCILQCKSVQTATFKLYIFKSNPTNSTWTNKSNPAINAADIPALVGVYTFSTPDSSLGTVTLYTVTGIGEAINAGGTSLYGVLVTTGTPTFTATSDINVLIGVLQD